MSSFRNTAAVMGRIARNNPDGTDEQLVEWFAEAEAEGRCDSPYGVSMDEDEPKDHAFNDFPVRES